MLKYWLWLTALMTPLKTAKLMQRFATPEQVFFASKKEFLELGFLATEDIELLSKKSFDMSEHILEQCDIKNIGIITMQDAHYPRRLRDIDDPPGVLYIKGSLNALSIEPAVGIVGTRDATPYGLNAAAMFSYNLAKSGLVIISGLAKGIDTIAHQGALRANRPTVAVLGCGADVVYPSENEPLYNDIINLGAVITEFPPGTRPLGAHFPKRNRLISGLSVGVLIVEAPLKSGALITARVAQEQGRDVFAVPGAIDAPNSVGCNRLIRDFAVLASEPSDILSEYILQYPVELGARRETPKLPKAEPHKGEPRSSAGAHCAPPQAAISAELTDTQAAIVKILRKGPLSPDDICAALEIEMREVLSELTMLEIEGAVVSNSAGIYSI
jgi:DNA processing protein